MGRTGWIAGVVLFAGAVGCADAVAETSDPISIRVLVVDEVGIDPNMLREAQQEAGRIFAAAGITLRWTGPEPPAGSLIVKIASNPVGQKGKNRNVLGLAPGSKDARGRIAWLFYHRIDEQSREFSLDVSRLLGHVMAHEMGHLLLPHGSHAVAGLMKGGWDTQQARLASIRRLGFESDQAAQIRARLHRAVPESVIPISNP